MDEHRPKPLRFPDRLAEEIWLEWFHESYQNGRFDSNDLLRLAYSRCSSPEEAESILIYVVEQLDLIASARPRSIDDIFSPTEVRKYSDVVVFDEASLVQIVTTIPIDRSEDATFIDSGSETMEERLLDPTPVSAPNPRRMEEESQFPTHHSDSVRSELYDQWRETGYDPEALLAMLPAARTERVIALWKLRGRLDGEHAFGALARAGTPIPFDSARYLATEFAIVDHLLSECKVLSEPLEQQKPQQDGTSQIAEEPLHDSEAQQAHVTESQRLVSQDNRTVWDKRPVELARQARAEHPRITMTATELSRKYLGLYVVRKKNGDEHSVESFAVVIRQLDTPNSTVRGRKT